MRFPVFFRNGFSKVTIYTLKQWWWRLAHPSELTSRGSSPVIAHFSLLINIYSDPFLAHPYPSSITHGSRCPRATRLLIFILVLLILFAPFFIPALNRNVGLPQIWPVTHQRHIQRPRHYIAQFLESQVRSTISGQGHQLFFLIFFIGFEMRF